jgi:hypothetical protein
VETPSIAQRIVNYRRRQRRERASRFLRSISWPAGVTGLLLLMAAGVMGLAH